MIDQPTDDHVLLRRLRKAGQIAQAIVMSILLFWAMLGLIEMADNIGLFRYQGY